MMTPTQQPQQQNSDDAKFQAILDKHNYTPSSPATTDSSGGWYDKLVAARNSTAAPVAPATDPLASVHIGGKNAVSPIEAIKQQAKGGMQQIKEGISTIQHGASPLEGGEAALKAESGVASIITSPLAPVFRPISEIIQGIGKKVGEIPAVQKFAMSPAGEATSRVAEDVSNLGNVAGTITGVDSAVKNAPVALEKAQEFGQKADATMNEGIKTLKTAIAPAPKPTINPDVVSNYYKAIKPTVGGKTTIGQKALYENNVMSGINSIIQHKDGLSFVDKNGEEITGRTPESPMEMAQAIDQTKKSIFDSYDALTKKADGVGAQVDTAPIAKELDKVINSEALQLTHPEAIREAQRVLDGLSVKDADGNITGYKKYDNETTQEIIKNYNTSLEAFYRNPSYDNASKAAISAGIVQNFREQLGKSIENATGEDYTALKKQYGALSAIEKDVNKRATVLARQQGGGLADYAQVFSGGDMVHGILSLNPALFAKGVAQSALTKLFQHLKSPDRAIQLMFKAAEQDAPSTLDTVRQGVSDAIGEPSIGLSVKDMTSAEYQDAVRRNVSEALAKYEAPADLKEAINNENNFRLEQLKEKDASGKALSTVELREAVGLLRKEGVETAPNVTTFKQNQNTGQMEGSSSGKVPNK